ncbi:alpha-glucosidase [Tamlana nanhaiensis]|uniref:Alpha-glucosidase n=1 Tax=Neotamlana nanhaiensis TaxID=1382798 RepID=A0A0D7W5H9_9FLAO|nr:alpha-xylosidase [Tamlana nanhaiensis]KJD34370.1 alpha-glucosidase [Tamlana nanhaiensis]
MNQTNHQFFDFLEFNTDLSKEEGVSKLWKACKPTAISQSGLGVVLTVPFQCQKLSNEIEPDKNIAKKEFYLFVRAFNGKILRVSIGFEKEIEETSPMIEMATYVEEVKLSFTKTKNKWVIKDANKVTRAVFDLSEPEIDYWSDLLPSPEESLQATFYPDGKKAITVSAYDQFFPGRMDAMCLSFIEQHGKPAKSTISFHAKPDEKFVGTGERFSKMNLSGNTFQLKNQDGQGVNNKRTYKNIPFYLSSEMYGLFLHTSSYCKFSMADFSTRSVQLLVEEPVLDIFLIGDDSPEKIIYQYKKITGFPVTPPLWSYGIWMSRMTYFSEEEINTICNRLREEDYPCDVIHLDTGWFETDWLCEWKFNTERFPNPKQFVTNLKNNGYRVSLWQMPYISENAAQYNEAKTNNYIGKLNTEVMRGGSNFSNLDYAGSIDFTYPKAVEWYKNLLRDLLELGVTCIKTDFGEEIHLDANYHNMAPEKLNNLYALLYQKAAFEVTKEVTGDGIVWARAGWSGCQRYPIHWGGDAAASWDGMAGSLKGGLHLGLSGFGFWSHDVPGFHGVPDFMNSVIPNDLYVRWTQFGVFTSHMRYHGTSKREPYYYPEITHIIRKWWKLRYALIPYILQEGEKTTTSGFPVTRALLMHHPKDKMVWHIDDQYYFGDHFMVAPMMNSENCRDIYLPEGKWINFFTGEAITGGVWLNNFEANIQDMPVWVVEGAEIPVYPEAVGCTDQMDLNKIIKLKIDKNFKGIWNHLEFLNT